MRKIVIDCHCLSLNFSYKKIMKSMNSELIDVTSRKMENDQDFLENLPAREIRAPVFWHQQKITAQHFLQYNLFICSKLLMDVQNLWFRK